MTVYGGLAERLVRDSLLYMLEGALEELGWMDAGRRHKPLQVLAKPLQWSDPVEPNLIGYFVLHTDAAEMEMGNSQLTSSTDDFVLTLLAESDSFGVHLSGDVRAILAGRLEEIGRSRATFSIMDFRLATPVPIGYAIIDDVELNRIPLSFKPSWEGDLFEINCTITYHYDSDVEAIPDPEVSPYTYRDTFTRDDSLDPGDLEVPEGHPWVESPDDNYPMFHILNGQAAGIHDDLFPASDGNGFFDASDLLPVDYFAEFVIGEGWNDPDQENNIFVAMSCSTALDYSIGCPEITCYKASAGFYGNTGRIQMDTPAHLGRPALEMFDLGLGPIVAGDVFRLEVTAVECRAYYNGILCDSEETGTIPSEPWVGIYLGHPSTTDDVGMIDEVRMGPL